jgi:2-polyprenyl-3-methyl-5-hydroxy-6-metoxy-1,4-benzoquinol methylase
MEKIKQFYNLSKNKELIRFKTTPYNFIEFYISMNIIKRYISKKSRIIDVGGGPGNYAFELAKLGYEVTLIDISEELINIAKLRNNKTNFKLKEISQQSITNLSDYKDNSFDAAICLGGVLSHILLKKDRINSIKELKRIVKKNGIIIISVISKFGGYRRILNEKYYKKIDKVVKFSRNPPKTGFTDAFFYTPTTFKKELKKAGIRVLGMYGCESLASINSELSNDIHKNKRKWEEWLKKLYSISSNDDVIWYSDHILAVCKNES